MTGVVRVSGKKRFLVRFQDGCENYLTSNQLTAVVLEKRPMEEGPDVLRITLITYDTVTSEKGYYHGVHVVLYFQKEDGVNGK